MKKRYFFLALTASFFVLIVIFIISLKVCLNGIGNSLGLLLEGNFFIPRESNICTFCQTKSDTGSGDGWLYGEDDKYYYGLNTGMNVLRSKSAPVYYILRKGEESQNFDKHNYKTWEKKEGIRWFPNEELKRLAEKLSSETGE